MQSKHSNRTPPPYFRVHSQRDPEAQKLSLVGDLDFYSASFLEDAFRQAEREDLQTLVLDLGRLEFMDCGGLSVCLAAKQRAERTGRRIVFVNIPAQVNRLLKITGQSHLLAPPDAMNYQRSESRAQALDPSQKDGVENEIRAREKNEWIEAMSDDLDMGEASTQYFCECSAPDCESSVWLSRTEYELIRSEGRRFVICVNHENPEIDMVTGQNEGSATVEKLPGEPTRIAEASDPRRVPAVPTEAREFKEQTTDP